MNPHSKRIKRIIGILHCINVAAAISAITFMANTIVQAYPS